MNKKTLGLGLNLLLATGAVAAMVVPAMVDSVPTMDNGEYWSATPTQAQDRDTLNMDNPNVPTLKEYAEDFPTCEAFIEGADTFYPHVLMVNNDRAATIVPTGEAYAMVDKMKNGGPQYWTVAGCP